MSTGVPVRAASTTASTTRSVFRPSRPLQIGCASPRMTAAKWATWLASGSLRSTASVAVSNGVHHDGAPGKVRTRMVGTDSDPLVPAMW